MQFFHEGLTSIRGALPLLRNFDQYLMRHFSSSINAMRDKECGKPESLRLPVAWIFGGSGCGVKIEFLLITVMPGIALHGLSFCAQRAFANCLGPHERPTRGRCWKGLDLSPRQCPNKEAYHKPHIHCTELQSKSLDASPYISYAEVSRARS